MDLDVTGSTAPINQALIPWYTLALAQLGSRATMRLLAAFQQPAAILAATPREWTARAQLTGSACTRLLNAINTDVSADLARLQRLKIRLLTLHDADYPARLRTIPDPPCVLFIKGQLPPPAQPVIAIVGSRRASPYGRQVSGELAAGLAQRGYAVASGMALGADGAAHEGCLRANGLTIAVLGCGVDIIYPPEHAGLYERIAAHGAIVSEMPLGAPPSRSSFPIRNRIISGLAVGVVVVEAAEKSGALITADHALEQGREVFAVPGSVNSTQSKGSHRLLREGAKLVESVEDILEDLPETAPMLNKKIAPLSGPVWDNEPDAVPTAPPIYTASTVQKASTSVKREPRKAVPIRDTPSAFTPQPSLPPEEALLLPLLSSVEKHIDLIISESSLAPAQVNAALLMLELKGFIQRRPGNHYVRLQ